MAFISRPTRSFLISVIAFTSFVVGGFAWSADQGQQQTPPPQTPPPRTTPPQTPPPAGQGQRVPDFAAQLARQAETDKTWRDASEGVMQMEKTTYKSRVDGMEIP